MPVLTLNMLYSLSCLTVFLKVNITCFVLPGVYTQTIYKHLLICFISISCSCFLIYCCKVIQCCCKYRLYVSFGLVAVFGMILVQPRVFIRNCWYFKHDILFVYTVSHSFTHSLTYLFSFFRYKKTLVSVTFRSKWISSKTLNFKQFEDVVWNCSTYPYP